MLCRRISNLWRWESANLSPPGGCDAGQKFSSPAVEGECAARRRTVPRSSNLNRSDQVASTDWLRCFWFWGGGHGWFVSRDLATACHFTSHCETMQYIHSRALLQEIVNRLTPLGSRPKAHRSAAADWPRREPGIADSSWKLSHRPAANDRIERHLDRSSDRHGPGNQRGRKAIADRLQVAVHAALFADPNFGGPVHRTSATGLRRDIEMPDATAAAIRHVIRSRTAPGT